MLPAGPLLPVQCGTSSYPSSYPPLLTVTVSLVCHGPPRSRVQTLQVTLIHFCYLPTETNICNSSRRAREWSEASHLRAPDEQLRQMGQFKFL